jgi:L-threonylcarbamoyladenylate synthase
MSPKFLTADDAYLEPALEILKKGGIIISPTTTNYNILCDATNPESVQRVFQAKKRTKVGPLPVSLPYPQLAREYVHIPPWFDSQILEALLPGEISFIFEQKYPFPDQLTCGLRTVSISCTTHPLMRSIVIGMEGPVAATSANLSGQGDIFVSLEKAISDLGSEVDLIIDSGPTEAQLATHVEHRSNTIIDLTFEPPYLCRKGWIPLSAVFPYFPTLNTDISEYKQRLNERISNKSSPQVWINNQTDLKTRKDCIKETK